MMSYVLPSISNPFQGMVERATERTVGAGVKVAKGVWFVASRGCVLCVTAIVLVTCAVGVYWGLLGVLMPIVHQSADVQLYSDGE